MVKIAITGANGRMGQALVRLVHQNENTQLVGAIVRHNSPHIGKDALSVSSDIPCGVMFSDNAQSIFEEADIVIDFCPAGSTQKHLKLAIQKNTKMVIGTTGLDDDMEQKIAVAGLSIPIVYASNFSVGVNLMLAMCEKSGQALDSRLFKTHIEETHHVHKLDAPSGTAISMGKALAHGRDTNFSDVYKYKQERENSADITFTDIREGEVIGDHTITFTSPLETFSIAHNAHDRDVFAHGAIVASIWVNGMSPSLYSMRNVLGL